MTAAELKPCTYRRGQRGQLICTVAQVEGGDTSNIVSAEVCQECTVPDQMALANCEHLQSGVRVFHIRTFGGPHSQMAGISFDCTVYQFETAEELFEQCASDCPKRKPIHRDVSEDLPLTVRDLPANPTDRDIRQGVLVALYEYHARLPERFLKFDVTPVYLAESLGLQVRDIYRVLTPMDEAGEVRTVADVQDVLPRYVTITHKGIEAINEEPLFESKGVRVTDNSIKIEGNNNQVAREHGQNEQQNVQVTAPKMDEVIRQLQGLRGQIQQEDIPADTRVQATEIIDMVFEEAERPEPRPARVVTHLRSLHRLLEDNQGTIAAAALITQLITSLN